MYGSDKSWIGMCDHTGCLYYGYFASLILCALASFTLLFHLLRYDSPTQGHS